jgi:hypothetical protein
MEEYTIFHMNPLHGGGYGPRLGARTVTGYLSRLRGGKEKIIDGLRTENQQAGFWVEDDGSPKGSIRQGEFVEDSGELYTFVHDDGFVREAGFVVYDLQIVATITDKQVTNTKVDDAIRSDYE